MSYGPAEAAQYLREFRKNYPEKNRAYQKRWNEKNREKYLAQKKVANEIVAGRIIPRPCFCGAKAHAHHDDYSRPTDVIWLCPKHHK